MAAIPSLINKTMRYGEWLFEHQLHNLEKADELAAARRLELERGITFDEVIEELAQFSEPRQQLFMEAFREGVGHDKETLWLLIDQAKDRVVDKKLKGD